jgi:serine/threonine protein kinase
MILFFLFYFFKAKVLKFLYENKISHMDLKPENILLTSIDRPILKVAGRNMMIIYIFQFSSFNQ